MDFKQYFNEYTIDYSVLEKELNKKEKFFDDLENEIKIAESIDGLECSETVSMTRKKNKFRWAELGYNIFFLYKTGLVYFKEEGKNEYWEKLFQRFIRIFSRLSDADISLNKYFSIRTLKDLENLDEKIQGDIQNMIFPEIFQKMDFEKILNELIDYFDDGIAYFKLKETSLMGSIDIDDKIVSMLTKIIPEADNCIEESENKKFIGFGTLYKLCRSIKESPEKQKALQSDVAMKFIDTIICNLDI